MSYFTFQICLLITDSRWLLSGECTVQTIAALCCSNNIAPCTQYMRSVERLQRQLHSVFTALAHLCCCLLHACWQRFTTYENVLYDAVTRHLNTALTLLFFCESLLKMCGFGLRVRGRGHFPALAWILLDHIFCMRIREEFRISEENSVVHYERPSSISAWYSEQITRRMTLFTIIT